MNKNKLFSVKDYIVLTLTVISIFLGIFGVIVSPSLSAKAVCVIFSVACLLWLLIYIFKYKYPEYRQLKKAKVTLHGIYVFLSKNTLNFIDEKIIEKWTVDCMIFWEKTMNWSIIKQIQSLQNLKIYLIDLPYITSNDGRKYRGMYQNDIKSIYIVTIPKNDENISSIQLIESLFRHELSHHIVTIFGEKYDNDIIEQKQHDLFKEKGLNA